MALTQLTQLPGVASVGVSGDRKWEIWVVVDPAVLAARSLSLTDISRALRTNLRDLPGGSIKSESGDIRLRGMGVVPDADKMAQIPLRNNLAGGVLRLGDVASIQRRLEEALTLGRFNGKAAVNMTVSKTADASTIEVAQRVRDYLQELRPKLPASVNAGLFSDLSIYVKTRLQTVTSSGLVGLVLVLLSLYLLLNFRVAFITALGIPVSFLVAIIIISLLGYSINMISLFAFLIALGLIVDDAIIVTENVYRHIENGENSEDAARIGAKEVFWPVVASTATTIAAFTPMFAIGGTMGAFIAVIPAIVSASLTGSLMEAFGVLPSHASEWLRTRKSSRKKSRIDWKKLNQRYTDLLRSSLHTRYFTALIAVGLLLVSLLFAATRLPFLLFGTVEVGQFFINIETPNSYSIDDSAKLARLLEKEVFAELEDNELKTLLTNVGVTFIDFHRVRFGSQYIQLIIDLEKTRPQGFIERWVAPVVSMKFKREGSRQRSTNDIINRLRDRIAGIPGVVRMSVMRPQGGPAGSDLEIGISGDDVGQLQQLALEVRDYVQQIAGTYDVRQDMDPGKTEYRYQLNERGRQLGLTQTDLAEAVRTGFLGLEAVYVNWQDKRIPVRLIYDDSSRHSSAALDELQLVTPTGSTVYLNEVASIETARGYNTINRRDMKRMAKVIGEVDKAVTTPNQVIALIKTKFAHLSEQHPGYQLLFLGSKKKAAESITDIKGALIIALAIIFFILASLFRSLLDPFVVMLAIPFGAIGVIVGHVIFNIPIQFLSMIGFLALTGIVVNDSLILVDFAHKLRDKGWDRVDAMVEAGRIRIRPILLTSITTFLGISPLIFFASGQTAFLSPMAISLGFGLLFATALILLALPSFYMIADDLRQWSRGLLQAQK
ncbi:MAG: efflux RND transporter permease subunit [gamma proteobacterium symbiont of Bathyaustriella thionipta]|nr:efflux RND transporter permease subunit [gamma proteobacterium symbiont of Bathyaustriella thionipta]